MSVFEDMGDWGYCRHCDRLELLDDDGKMIQHDGAMSHAVCLGAGEEPTEPPAEREHYGPEPLTPDPVHSEDE